MISVLIQTLNDEARLVDCLAPLVPASMSGLVRELIIVDGGSTDATLEIAEDAGARIIKGGAIGEGAKAAKGPWLLVLDPRVRLELGWEASVQRHMNNSCEAARFRLYRANSSGLSRLLAPKATALLVLKEAGDRSGGFGANRRLGGVRLLDARAAVGAV